MSVRSEIDRIRDNVAGAYSAVSDIGGTLPEQQTSDNLEAAIRSIPVAEDSSFPVGGIIMWSGLTVPTGWALCNGQNGTPDLRGKFILGASDTHAMGETGGEETHKLTTDELASHSHVQRLPSDNSVGATSTKKWVYRVTSGSLDTGTRSLGSGIVTNNAINSSIDLATASTGSGTAHNNMPPYYTLAYIMKL